jgi:hypothetical protein
MLNPPHAAPFGVVGVADIANPLLSKASEDEDEDDDNNSSAMITGNLFVDGSGVGVGGGCDDEYGGEEGYGEDDLDFPNPDVADSMPDA